MRQDQGYQSMASAILASMQLPVYFGFPFFQNPAMQIPIPTADLRSEHP